jgi:hypothetical protein
VLTGFASAQVNPTPPGKADATAKDKIATALDRLKQGDLAGADINLLAKAGAVQAIPDLRKQFELLHDDNFQDQISKDAIASALVRLGDKDPAWWDYLVQRTGRRNRQRRSLSGGVRCKGKGAARTVTWVYRMEECQPSHGRGGG